MGEFASTFEIKKRGYVPGEYIEISGDLANAMNASVTKVGAILEQVSIHSTYICYSYVTSSVES